MPAITFEDEEQKRRFREMLMAQMSQPVAPKKEGFISRNLPTIGAIGAGVIAAPLTGGLSLIPSIALAGGAAAAGAGVGEFSRQKLRQENDPDKMFKEMAYGLAGGAGGQAIGRGIQTLKAARVAKAGIKVGENQMSKGGFALRKATINPNVTPSPTSLFKEDDLVRFASDEGLHGSGKAMQKQIADNSIVINSQIDNALSKSKRAFSGKTVIGQLKNTSNGNINFVPGDVTFEKARERALSKLTGLAQGNKLTLRDLFKFKNELGGRLSNAFRKVQGSLSSPLTINEGAEMSLWEGIDDVITRIEPGVKELTKRQSMYHQLTPGIYDRANALFKVPGIGIPIPGASRLAQSTADTVGRAMSGVGGMTLPNLPPLPLNAVGRTIEQAGVRQFGDEPPALEGDMYQGMDFPTMPQEQPQQEEYTGGFTAEGIQQAMMQDLMISGGKNLKFLEQLAKISGVDGKEEKISSKQQETLGKLSSAENTVTILANQFAGLNQSDSPLGAYASGIGKGLAGKFNIDPRAKAYSAARQGLASTLLKSLGESGTLSDQDIKRAVALIPDLTDSLEVARRKFATLQELIGGVRQGVMSLPTTNAGGLPSNPSQLF